MSAAASEHVQLQPMRRWFEWVLAHVVRVASQQARTGVMLTDDLYDSVSRLRPVRSPLAHPTP